MVCSMYKAVLSWHVVQWLVLRIQMHYAKVMISEANNLVHAKSHARKKPMLSKQGTNYILKHNIVSILVIDIIGCFLELTLTL